MTGAPEIAMGANPALKDAFVRFARDLLERPPVEVHVYLDEKGTAGEDRRFITGGAAIHGDIDAITTEWHRFAWDRKLRGKKGRDFKNRELLEAADFLSTKALLPVGFRTHFSDEELEKLRAFARGYSESTSPAKRFKKMTAHSYLWKQQMTQAAAVAFASVTSFVGPVSRAELHVDRMCDPPEVQRFYKDTLSRNMSRTHMAALLDAINLDEPLHSLLLRSVPDRWSIDLNAKGPLAHLADVACTMYERWVTAAFRDAWDVLRHAHFWPGTLIVPPCMGFDGTPQMRHWLDRLYTAGDPDTYAARLAWACRAKVFS